MGAEDKENPCINLKIKKMMKCYNQSLDCFVGASNVLTWPFKKGREPLVLDQSVILFFYFLITPLFYI